MLAFERACGCLTVNVGVWWRMLVFNRESWCVTGNLGVLIKNVGVYNGELLFFIAKECLVCDHENWGLME